ncbi:MAG: twin-arginine translocation signal domain-containing protein, partial [Acidobacteriaceae bacterium]
MSLSRRNFLAGGSLAVAAGVLSPLALEAEKKPGASAHQVSPARYDDWNAVRREFDLDPDYIHLGLFYIASHPRPVREAIEAYRKKLDANPFLTV